MVPEKGGEKAFELLRQAMKQEGKVAIAKTVMGNGEKLLTIIPTEQGILIETMFFADEIKELPKEVTHADVNDAELTMAKTLIGSMDKEFEPEQYHDEYQVRLRELIEKKIQGKEIVTPVDDVENNVIDLMEALRASLAQTDDTPPKKTTRKKTRKGA